MLCGDLNGKKIQKGEDVCVCVCVCVCIYALSAKSLQSCPTLCNPKDCSPLGSSVHVILQARILEWVACPPPGDLPDPGIKPASLTSTALTDGFFSTSGTWEALVLTQI